VMKTMNRHLRLRARTYCYRILKGYLVVQCEDARAHDLLGLIGAKWGKAAGADRG
jgi:hypothetical protein